MIMIPCNYKLFKNLIMKKATNRLYLRQKSQFNHAIVIF